MLMAKFLNLFNLLERLIDTQDDGGATTEQIGNSADELCTELASILKIVGIVIWGIKVVVPIILIIIGMLDLAKAVTEKSEDKIKEAQQKLIKRAIAAVLVFLVVTFVSLLMRVIGGHDYQKCMTCVNHPFQCEIEIENINSDDD